MMWDASTAHAAEHVYAETATSISGLEGTDKTHSMNDNKITLGTEGGPTDKPFSTYGTISGGGKKDATEDVSNNTLTIHGLKVSNGSGQSMIYGGVSGTGAVTSNHVVFNNGLSKDPIYGGFNGASATKAVTGNSVTVAGGTVEGDAFGGYTTGKGAVTGNSVTIKGGSLGDEAAGGVISNSASSANAADNTLTISGGAFTKSGGTNVFGAYNAGSGKTINNIVNLGDGENAMASGFNLTRVRIYGGNKTNDVTGNTLNVNASGIVVRTAQNFEKYNFNLTKGVVAGSTMLKVTDSGGFGSTPNVQWSKITMGAEGWNTDTTKYGRLGTMELLRTGSGADLKIFNTEALDRKATSGDFEYHMYTDVTTPPMFFGYNMVNYVRADIDRFQNADATADNVTGTEVYGGYSSLGNTTTNNKIKITNTNNTNLTVYGGYTAGAGDSTNNHVTITATGKVKSAYGGYATAANGKAEGNIVTVESGGWVDNTSYAGWAKGAVNRNIFTVKGHADWSVFGGKLDGGGTAEGNEVRVDGGTVNGFAVGARGGTDAVVTGNKVTVTNGTVKKNITGGQSAGGNGKATRNVVAITGSTIEENVSGGLAANSGTVSDNQVSISDSVIKKSVHGGYDPASGTVTGNNVAVSGSSTVEDILYGGRSEDSGRVTGNTVNISDGTFKKRIFGGYSDKSGTVTENKVTITGGRFEGVVYGGAGGDSSGSGTFTANNNVVTIAGGTFSGDIYGAYSWRNDSTTENNTVNLGDDTHRDLSGATLSASDIYGGNKAATGNTLNVNAKNIAAKSVNKFENYNFKLNESFGNGDTMLSVANAGDFGGTGVDWRKISVDRSGLSADYVSNVHGVHRVTLLKSATANALNFSNYAATIYAATDTHESAVQTDTDSGTATSVFMEINRFKNGRVTYDGTGETYAKTWGNEIYGGLSHDGHTTTGNQLTVKALRGAGDPSHVFGGKNEGTTGDVTQNTVDIELAHDADTIAEVYGGQANNVDGAGKVDGNIANMKKGTVNLLYAGYTFGDGAVTNNTVNFSGGKSTGYIGGGYIDKATSTAEVSYNKVFFTDGTAGQIRGGLTIGSGAAKKNAVEFSAGTATGIRGAEIEGGTAEENEVVVKGGTVSGDVYGAETRGTGEAKNNTVTISGGAVNAEVAGGVGYTANIVTLTGGTVSGNVYGGKSVGPGSSTSENIVNLGAEDGTYTANLDNASIYGDNSTDSAVNNNTLNVFGKGITVHSVKNFDKYNFKLNNNIASGDTMLTLRNGGFGREIDFANNFDVDTSKLTGKPTGTITLLKSETANALTFKDGYVPRDLGSTENAEYFIGTDTGTRTATSVIMNYNIFRNNEWTYNGTNPATANEVAGGISYKDGNTTYNNKITVTGVPSTNLNFVYGGKTNGAADSKENQVTIESTGTGSIANINGGYTGKTDGVASKNRVLIKGGTVTNVVGGAVSGANASAQKNEVRIEGGTVTNVYGGKAGTLSKGNKISLKDSATATNLTGGEGASSEGDSVVVEGGTVNTVIVGGKSTAGNVVKANVHLNLKGGTVSGTVYGADSAADATDNGVAVAVEGGTVNAGIYGAKAAGTAERNWARLDTAVTGDITGALSTGGNASRNIVEVNADVTGSIVGGNAAAGNASGNKIVLQQVTVTGNVTGGLGTSTDNNLVSLKGTKVLGDVVGGANGVGNTLAVHLGKSEIHDFNGIQNLQFYLADGVTSSTPPLLQLGVNNKDIQGVNVGVGVSGRAPSLRVADTISLMKLAPGGTLTTDATIPNHIEGMQGVSLLYGFDITRRGTDELVATVTKAAISEQTKSFVETRAAATDFINRGADLLAGSGMASATKAAGGDREDVSYGDYNIWAAMSNSSMKVETGSYVDTKGWNLSVGWAKEKALKDGRFVVSPFVEYGKGKYDSFLDDGTHGSGSVSYIGAGVLARMEKNNGLWAEGVLHGGRAKSDYAGSIQPGLATSYDSSNNYIAAELGLGKKMELKKGRALDVYLRYFWSRQTGTEATLTSSETYDFGAVDSHRLRTGLRYSQRMSAENELYAGLAYEYEFSGKATASYDGYGAPSPSLRGGSALLELGWRFAPKDSRVSYDVNFAGWQGKRQGVSASVHANWAF